jgi:hypothetical protein
MKAVVHSKLGGIFLIAIAAQEKLNWGRLLAHWLFNWEKIGDNMELRTKVAQITGSWSEDLVEVLKLSK